MSSKKKIALGLSAAALAAGAGLGIAGAASATTVPAPAPSSSASADATPGADGHGMPGMGKGPHGHEMEHQASSLAAKLGVEEAQVTEALQAFREANRPTGSAAGKPAGGARPDEATRDAALAASLAGSLGLDESQVSAALAEVRTEAQVERAGQLSTRLDQAVTDGTLTQAEADAVTKAVDNGVIGGGGH